MSACGWSCVRRTRARRRSSTTASATRPWRRPTTSRAATSTAGASVAVHPAALDLVGDLFVELGAAYTENWFELDPRSTLAADMNAGAPAVRELLGTATSHGRAARRERSDPTRATPRSRPSRASTTSSRSATARRSATTCRTSRSGQRHVSLLPCRSPRRRPRDPGGGRLAVRRRAVLRAGALRGYVRVRRRHGVRGIPGQRYYGRIKLFSNVEPRFAPARLHRVPQVVRPGRPLFTDFGRLWTDFGSHPELDGSGLGLKYGVGGGCAFSRGRRPYSGSTSRGLRRAADRRVPHGGACVLGTGARGFCGLLAVLRLVESGF